MKRNIGPCPHCGLAMDYGDLVGPGDTLERLRLDGEVICDRCAGHDDPTDLAELDALRVEASAT